MVDDDGIIRGMQDLWWLGLLSDQGMKMMQLLLQRKLIPGLSTHMVPPFEVH